MDHVEASTAQANFQPLVVEDWDADQALNGAETERSWPRPNKYQLPPMQKPKRQMLRASISPKKADKPVPATIADYLDHIHAQALTCGSSRQEKPTKKKDTKRRKKLAVVQPGGEPAKDTQKINSK